MRRHTYTHTYVDVYLFMCIHICPRDIKRNIHTPSVAIDSSEVIHNVLCIFANMCTYTYIGFAHVSTFVYVYVHYPRMYLLMYVSAHQTAFARMQILQNYEGGNPCEFQKSQSTPFSGIQKACVLRVIAKCARMQKQ